MNSAGRVLKEFGFKSIVMSNDGKILASDIEDDKLINDCIECVQNNTNKFSYDNKYYQVRKVEDQRRTTYWIQDISEIYNFFSKDKLTKLYNRLIAEPMIDEYIINSSKTGEQFSVIMGDIDHFKQINDTFGHDKGDEALSDTSKVLLNSFRTRDKVIPNGEEFLVQKREKDILCRYGGEEFLIIVKNINLEDTIQKVETIREIIEERGILTMSFGIFNFDSKNIRMEINKDNVKEVRKNMIKIADDCLYNSKHSGRNQLSYFCPETNEIKSNKEKQYKKGV